MIPKNFRICGIILEAYTIFPDAAEFMVVYMRFLTVNLEFFGMEYLRFVVAYPGFLGIEGNDPSNVHPSCPELLFLLLD